MFFIVDLSFLKDRNLLQEIIQIVLKFDDSWIYGNMGVFR